MGTYNIPLSVCKRISPLVIIILNQQLLDFFQGTQERVQNSRGKGAISVEQLKSTVFGFTR